MPASTRRLRPRVFWAALTALTLSTSPSSATGAGSKMPPDFVYLRDIDPSIEQDMRYASANNFTGAKVRGYNAPECILRRATALALSRAQQDMLRRGFSLKVYDCYRPARAVRAFAEWAAAPEDGRTRDYYPRLRKTELFEQGYIARRSSHSLGTAIDLTIVKLPVRSLAKFNPELGRAPCHAPPLERAEDNSVDMGTAFDCFDIRSHTMNREVSDQIHDNRMKLLNAMRKHGFANYHKEWWHFSYARKRYPRVYFNFPIAPRKGGAE